MCPKKVLDKENHFVFEKHVPVCRWNGVLVMYITDQIKCTYVNGLTTSRYNTLLYISIHKSKLHRLLLTGFYKLLEKNQKRPTLANQSWPNLWTEFMLERNWEEWKDEKYYLHLQLKMYIGPRAAILHKWHLVNQC